ncbi:MAG TPA: CRISPR-associated endonuclease Cas2 [Saprospiraceae bacterium]|nr:CRISPR-associated endonuclease Cas2 [Saprospiraceae bacterium]HMQ85746.1 CRISPR-associated endonuclease Cas2 [Saprospiraceae bacterium]
MPILICYDISKNSLRNRLGQKILEYGLDRINKSVYLGSIADNALTKLEKDLADQLLQKGQPQDSLIILPVNAQHIQDMRIYGQNDLDKAEISGDKSTLIV